ncbi:hypothetical protein Tco_1528594, partial [Tanacetum coccineum]
MSYLNVFISIQVQNVHDIEEIKEESTRHCEISLTPSYHLVLVQRIHLLSTVTGSGVGIKRLHDDLEVTAAKVCVTAAKL